MSEQHGIGLRAYGNALVANWFAAMSGGLGVPASIMGVFFTSGPVQIVFWITALICLVVSTYVPWRVVTSKLNEELKSRESEKLLSQQQITALQAQIDLLSKPNFSIEFFSALLGEDLPISGSHALFFFRLNNTGTKAAVFTSEWELEVATKDGKKYKGNPSKVEQKTKFKTNKVNPQWGRVYVADDWILGRASSGVDRFGYAEGILIFLLPGLNYDALIDDSTVLTISGKAVGGSEFKGRVSVKWFRDNSSDKFNTSLTYPHEVLLSDHGG